MKVSTKLANRIVYSMINSHDDWELSEFEYKNNKLNIVLWIANGSSFISIHHPTKIYFNYWQRKKLWKAYEESVCLKILKLSSI